MASALFDSNIVIDLASGSALAYHEFARYQSYFISRIIWIEVLTGANATTDKETRRLLKTFHVLELSLAVSERTAVVRRQHKLKLPDAIIYATALEHGLTLVTRNTKDFHAGMPGVRIPYTP